MAQNGGLLITCGSWRRAGRIEWHIDRDNAFTTVVDTSDGRVALITFVTTTDGSPLKPH